ncbi:glutamine amidotransferase [Xenorhabdus sp. 18]|uniref:glutamine amidotransferase n=1 Tax=Xenorhabdus doucetiae TaxID=351671 RepID=UPI0019ADF6D6|nr:glutamine amidotransferase [Xenorhabdus sp. 18]MBD2796403.1 glutamine amidotransferase [Xenorhabdus sp. 18]
MKTAIALRHIYFEDVGILDTVLTNYKYELEYIDPTLNGYDKSKIQNADLLIVLGGPIGAYDEKRYPFLKNELALIEQWLQSGKPLLGICLGAQLIARALGANVYPLGVKEIGFSPLTLTSADNHPILNPLKDIPVFHWHGDQFDIPIEGIHLASTPIGTNQAFSIGNNILGLQFHLEVNINALEKWLVGHANELIQTNIDPRKLRTDARLLGNSLTIAAHEVFANWLDNLEDVELLC